MMPGTASLNKEQSRLFDVKQHRAVQHTTRPFGVPGRGIAAIKDGAGVAGERAIPVVRHDQERPGADMARGSLTQPCDFHGGSGGGAWLKEGVV